MTSYENMNILEPIDPLNISFSEDKCVKTPETLKSDNTSSKECPKIVIKDPKELFGYDKTKSYTSPKKSSYLSKTYYNTSRKYDDRYVSPIRTPRMEVETWNRRYSNYKPAQPLRNIGKVSPGEQHLREIKKLDSLIRKISDRIEVSKKYFP